MNEQRLSRYETADYIGVPAVTLDQLIRERRMPAAGDDGKWSLKAVDLAFDLLPPLNCVGHRWEKYLGVGGVYVAGFGIYLKVGYSRKIGYRLSAIESGIPELLVLHGVIAGATQKEERALHRAFHEWRLGGEWFKADPFILDYIQKQRTDWQ